MSQMYEYEVSPLALEDLTAIRDYVAQDRPVAAANLLGQFEEAFQFLAANPLMGEIRPEFRSGQFRSFSTGSYVIYYTSSARGIRVARVVHGARDTRSIRLE